MTKTEDNIYNIKDDEDCLKCHLLMELYNKMPDDIWTNRDYWIMTELFVWLHNGKDYCDKTNNFTLKKLKKIRGDLNEKIHCNGSLCRRCYDC